MSRKKILSEKEIIQVERHNAHVRSERKRGVFHFIQLLFPILVLADGLCLWLFPIQWWEYMDKPAFIFFWKYGGTATGSWILRKFLHH